MAQVKNANTYCRNCGKHYYACKYCIKNQTWRSFCCSKECHEEYVKTILDERESMKLANNTNNTDLSNEELENIKSMTSEEALKQTKEDLKDYIEENPDISLSEVINLVNNDIDEIQSKKIKKKK